MSNDSKLSAIILDACKSIITHYPVVTRGNLTIECKHNTLRISISGKHVLDFDTNSSIGTLIISDALIELFNEYDVDIEYKTANLFYFWDREPVNVLDNWQLKSKVFTENYGFYDADFGMFMNHIVYLHDHVDIPNKYPIHNITLIVDCDLGDVDDSYPYFSQKFVFKCVRFEREYTHEEIKMVLRTAQTKIISFRDLYYESDEYFTGLTCKTVLSDDCLDVFYRELHRDMSRTRVKPASNA